MKISLVKLKQNLAAVIDPTFATQLVDNYTKMQQRYYMGDWQPSELNGGKFCEAAARAMYQLDTSVIDHELLPGKICDKLLDRDKHPVPHHTLGSKDRNHFCRVLQTIYKFRSDRGVAHVSALYNANHLDAILVVASVKWLFGEFLRLALQKNHDEVIAVIEAIVQMEHPLIYEIDGQPLVLSNALSAAEEVLVLLQRASNGRLAKSELKRFIHKDQSTISRAINQLGTNKEVGFDASGDVVITPLGQTRVYETIFPKLSSTNGNKASL